jgi:hypothetical protein
MFFTNFGKCQSNKYLKKILKEEKLIEIYKKLCKFRIRKRFKDITIAFFLKCSIEDLIKILEVLESYDLGQFDIEKTRFLLNIPNNRYISGIQSLKTKLPKSVWERLNFERKTWKDTGIKYITTADIEGYCFN